MAGSERYLGDYRGDQVDLSGGREGGRKREREREKEREGLRLRFVPWAPRLVPGTHVRTGEDFFWRRILSFMDVVSLKCMDDSKIGLGRQSNAADIRTE